VRVRRLSARGRGWLGRSPQVGGGRWRNGAGRSGAVRIDGAFHLLQPRRRSGWPSMSCGPVAPPGLAAAGAGCTLMIPRGWDSGGRSDFYFLLLPSRHRALRPQGLAYGGLGNHLARARTQNGLISIRRLQPGRVLSCLRAVLLLLVVQRFQCYKLQCAKQQVMQPILSRAKISVHESIAAHSIYFTNIQRYYCGLKEWHPLRGCRCGYGRIKAPLPII
jgi:hypothetical protein